ncbi:uncharacterized protein GIQ15_05046 [Arthroderma uncinatum]|uniref:uncharacterized protein n=1 Tax=Arthroderma uncinatum TaxID=74035 RepID=UPI00144A9D33|nr:uncharacterized protein GIQ15_05046 [Arthroderma uncinatum]KAF3482287.1 hypothetical protein GIQ15_05046 [Arthroderma uncinatum]
MLRSHRATPGGESQPPKSRSASAKHQQSTSSRLTRSRSRELGEAPAHSSFKVPSIPQKSDYAAGQTFVLRTPRTSDASSRGNGLSPITESRANEARHSLEFSPSHQSNISQTYVAESHADHGNISGTTMFQADDSEREAEEVDLHLILDTLPDLLTASNKALRLLTPSGLSYANISKHFQTSKFGARLNRIKETFDAQKKCMSKDSFIPIERFVAALSSIKPLDWKPRGIYQKANLAQLALDLIRPQPTTLIEAVDNSFPFAFIESVTSSKGDDLKTETVQLGLEIRTQHFIANLRSKAANQTSKPEELLEDVFFSSSLGEDDGEIRGWQMDGLEDDSCCIPEEYLGIAEERIDLIRRCLGKDGELEAEFPWSEFVVGIAGWIRAQASDIDKQLESQMPIEEATKILQAELDKQSSFGPGHTLDRISSPILDDVEPPAERNPTPERSPAPETSVETSKEAEEQSQAIASPSPPQRHRFKGKGALQRLLGLGTAKNAPPKPVTLPAAEEDAPPRGQHNEPTAKLLDYDDDALLNVGATTPSPPRDLQTEAAPVITIQGPPLKDRSRSEPEERVPPLSSLDILRLSEEGIRTARSTKQDRPRAAFIDRQLDAHRVSPISTQSDRHLPNGPKKRTAEDAFHVEESEEDTGFETDTRPRKLRRERPHKTPAPPRPTATASSSIDSTADSRLAARTTYTVPASTAPHRFEQIAETLPAFNVKIRRPWSLEEETCLRELIEECGPSWAKIKELDSRAGNILHKRSQGHIKDKGGQMLYDDLM